MSEIPYQRVSALTPTFATRSLSDEEKKLKSLRKQVQEVLIKFATRIPVFMYLTDFREACLKDVINKLEPELFQRVTGLKVSDFELLVHIGVFKENLMNESVYLFRRYEDSSLNYTGINRHAGESRGLFATSISEADYEAEKMRDTYVGVDAFQSTLNEAVGLTEDEVEDELPNELVEAEAVDGETFADEEQDDGWTQEDLDNLQVGDMVRHRSFGVGPVTSIDGEYITLRVGGRDRTFAFPGAFEGGFLSFD